MSETAKSEHPLLAECGLTREQLGEWVREAWVRWATKQPSPKPSWLVPYAELNEADQEADRHIGESIALFTIAHWTAQPPPSETKP